MKKDPHPRLRATAARAQEHGKRTAHCAALARPASVFLSLSTWMGLPHQLLQSPSEAAVLDP